MKPLTLNNANELAVELTQLDGQTRYVCKVGPGAVVVTSGEVPTTGYTIQVEHEVDFTRGKR